MDTYAWLFQCAYWGCKLRSSCVHSKHVILGVTVSQAPVREFLNWINWRSRLDIGSTISWTGSGGRLHNTGDRDLNTSSHCSLLPDFGNNANICLVLCHRDFPAAMHCSIEVWAKRTLPSLSCFCQVFCHNNNNNDNNKLMESASQQAAPRGSGEIWVSCPEQKCCSQWLGTVSTWRHACYTAMLPIQKSRLYHPQSAQLHVIPFSFTFLISDSESR